MNDYIGEKVMNMIAVKAEIKPWLDANGNVRYYVNNLHGLLDDYRAAKGVRMDTSYDWENMRASPARVRLIIEGNILPKTKAYIDGDGHVHVYGWATAGVGEQMGLASYIESAIDRRYGFCSETERLNRLIDLVRDCMLDGQYALAGDTVLIKSGRKEPGKEFVVSKKTCYSYSQWARPSIYLHAEDGFKVNADHCEIIDIGHSYVRA